jgi:hypothetical protein
MFILDPRRAALATALSLSLFATGAAAQAGAAEPAPAGSAATAPEEARPARRDRNRVTEQELRARVEPDLYAFLQGARPAWLRPRGRSSFSLAEQVRVYRDGSQIGNITTLRQIQPGEIREIQYLDSTKATERFGVDHGAGAILLTSR